MKHIIKIASVLLLVTILTAGCASSKKGHCGCPGKSGMVGY
ncbi:MAG: hypothetical protein ABIP68_00300 [Ferruginibacter sp.]